MKISEILICLGFFIGMLFWGFFLGYNYPHSPINTEIQQLLKTEQEIRDRIELLLTVQSIIICESSGKHDVWGDGDKKYPTYGVGQFQQRTFYWLAGKAGLKNMNWKSKEDQLKLLIWAVDNGYGKLWSCFK